MRTAIFYNFLIEANIMASMAIILMAILRRWLRKPLGNQALMFGWLLVTLRLLLPISIGNPIIHTIRSPFANDPAIRPIAGQIKVRLSDFVNDLTVHTKGDTRNNLLNLNSDMGNGMLSINLFKLYLIVAAIVLAVIVYRNIRFRQWLKKAKVIELSGEALKHYEALCENMKLKPVPVYLIDPLPAASLVGIFKPYIALPLHISKEDIPLVLRHELCHLKHRDNLFGLLRLLTCVIHWFNPLVWLYASMSRTDMELRCDDSVTKEMDEEQKQQYAGILVKIASKKQTPGLAVVATGMTMAGKRLKNRVQDILSDEKTIGFLKVGFIVLSSMMLVAAFSTSEIESVAYDNGAVYDAIYSISNIKGTQKLDNTEQFLQCAEKIAHVIGAEGKVIEHDLENPNATWRFVSLRFDSGDIVECEMNRTGVVRYTGIITAGPRWNSNGKPSKVNYEKNTKAQEEARQTLKALLDSVNPRMTELYGDLLFQNSWSYEDSDFIHFWGLAKNGTMDDYFTMEIKEDGSVRLIYFTLGGNG